MPAEHPLCAIFLPAVSDPARGGLPTRPLLEPILAQICAVSQAAWPEFAVAAEAFLPYFAERVSREGHEALQKLRAADLYVACACVAGNPRAIGALEARY